MSALRPQDGFESFDFQTTFIDRSKCKRVVPMKVLVLGMSRTGTLSIRAALKRLGYVDTYHGFTLLWGNRSDIHMWREALEAKFEGKGKPFTVEKWDQLLGHCQVIGGSKAVTDMPCTIFAKELIEAYPDAKIILSLRDVDKWHASVSATLAPDWRRNRPGRRFRELYCNIIPTFSSSRAGFQKVLHYSLGENFAEKGRQRYNDHNNTIRALVPKEKLLEYHVQQGWGPLCEFLGEKVPDIPFPSGNEMEMLQERMGKLNNRSLMLATVLWVSCICFSGLGLLTVRRMWR